MKLIPLTQGHSAMVDDADYDALMAWSWHAHIDANTVYACRGDYSTGELVFIRMHRQLMDDPIGLDVDHRDGNGLNNQRGNLRSCTRSQNLMNKRGKIGGSSRYKGVYWLKANQKWRAKIMVDGRSKCLGLHHDELVAAQAYDTAAKKHFGEFARLNLS